MFSFLVWIGLAALLFGFVREEASKPKKKGGKKKKDFFDKAVEFSIGFSFYAMKHTILFLDRIGLVLGRTANNLLGRLGLRMQGSPRGSLRKIGGWMRGLSGLLTSYPRIPGVICLVILLTLLDWALR